MATNTQTRGTAATTAVSAPARPTVNDSNGRRGIQLTELLAPGSWAERR